MLNKERIACFEFWLRLIRDRNWSLHKKHQLLLYYKTPEAIFSAPEKDLSELTKKTYLPSKSACRNSVALDLVWLSHDQHSLVTFHDNAYPDLLKHVSPPPLALFIQGDESLLHDHQVSIVGSRRPTLVGQKMSHNLAAGLAELGIVVTSGMALGVDANAHQGALSVTGKTIAVMGCGLDRVYPARNKTLFSQIAREGLLVSEYPVGTPPHHYNFPERNRIVSGLAHGVVIVEAALKSGTMITARLAMEQNREVFVVPGSVVNKQYEGSHQLIKQGAILVQEVNDILHELSLTLQQKADTTEQKANEKESETERNEHSLLEFIEYEPTLIDDIIFASGLTAEKVSAMLVVLEIEGQVGVTNEGRYIRLM